MGLRAGTFESSLDDNGNQMTTLVNCAFAKDVTVNGTVVWGADLSLAPTSRSAAPAPLLEPFMWKELGRYRVRLATSRFLAR
jgi:hypothetical protein